MKKIFGFGKKREKQQSPSRPASGGATASPSGGEGGSLSGGGYEVWRSKDLGKLHRAAATGDLKKLQQLVRKHDLNQLDKANRTPLHLACASGNTDIVMFLVDNRCKLNLCDDDAKSPLMKAVQCQHELCATYLLEHGADTNLVDANGNTALHLAASNASISIAHRLIEHNARVDVQNKDGSTPLTIAITEDNHIMAEFLLKNGADIHFRDNAGRTPLLTAASHGKHNLVKLLLLHGADASHKDCNGWSAEDYALISGDPSLSQKIAEYANCRSGEKSSTGSKKDLSVFNSPDKAGDAGFTLGAPATNKEVVDDHSSDDSIRGSGKTDDSWRSSEGEELDFSPKKLQKPSLAQLMNVSQQLKKINIETGNNRPSKENFKAGAQISVHPNQQELKDQSDSLASNEEEEYEEGEEEEEESGDDDEEEEEEEEEAVEEDGESEMEDDFSEEREDENIVEEEESQGKIENEEEEYFNSGEREELSEMCVDNEHEAGGNHANTNISSSNNDICSVEEMQGTGHMPVSFIAGKYECSNENGAISKVNNELPNHSSERVNNNEAKEVNEFQNHEIPHECQESVVCSLETFEATALTKAALASPLKNNNDNGRNSNLSDSFESNDDHGSEVELEKCKARQQNSKSPVLVNYQDGRGKQYMDPEELQNAIYEPLVQKSENIEEENPKEIIPPNSKEDSSEEDEEKGDREEEMGNVLNKKLKKYDSKAQNLLKDDIVRKAALASEADEEEDDKDTESPWDSECISESPRKPSVGFLPTSPSKVRSHMHSISEEARNGKSDDLLPETTEANVDHVGSYTPLVMGTETREKQKSDLMEKLGLDDADDIEDESDWDSTSVSLKSVPSGKPFNILILEEHESPLQLRTSDAATKTSEVFPVGPEELPGSQVIIALEDKVACIHADLNSRILAVPGDVPQQPSSPIVVHYSQLVQPEEVDKVPSSVQEATCALDPCSSWLVKSAREGIGQQSNEEAIKETESDENEDKNVISTPSSVEKPSTGNHTYNTEASFIYDKKKTEAEIHNEESNIDHSQFDMALWEARYEKMWVANEKKEVKTNFKSITAELKQMFGEINVNEEVNDTPEEGRSQDGFSGILENINEFPPPHLSKTIIGIQGKDDSEDVMPVIVEKKLNTENLSLYPQNSVSQKLIFKLCEHGKQNVGENGNAHCEALSNNAEDTKVNIKEERSDNVFVQFETNACGKTTASEKCTDTSPMHSCKDIVLDVIFKNVSIKQPVITDDRNMLFDVAKCIAQETLHHFNTDVFGESTVSSCKDEAAIGNKVKNSDQSHHQASKKELDEELERDVARFKNEVGMLQIGFLALEKEKAQLQKEIYRTVDVNDFDDITQSSDTATEDVELPSSVFRDTTILIEQLSLDKKDSVNLLKFQNIFHGYERLIEHEKERYTRLLEKVKKRESEKREQQRLLKEMGEMKSVLDHQKAERERDISSLKFSLKQEEEKRMSAEMLYEKKQEQSRKKEKQYCKEMEEKQQLELMLRSLEMELRTLKNHLEEVDEERRDTQRQLAQEQNARALQEGILNTYLWKRKEMEEESKKIVSKSSETADNHDQEKELWHKNKILENELSVLKLELDHSRVRHQEEEANYLEENDILKEKVEELKKDLKLNEEALTQTVAQYSGQLNASKAECAMLISKLEFVKENKERLQVELDSFRSRLSSSTQELERCQLSRTDLERMLQREHDDWLRLKDKLNHDLCNLQETNNAMSQQLSKAESKGNSLESELHHVTHALREKNLLLESIQRDLSQAQCQVKELENARQVEKDQINKYAVKQDSLQERLAHLQSENILLRQQFEDLQNKGIIKEKVVTDVQDKFNDIFSKLRADFEKQVQLMEERNKELVNKCNNLREQTFKYEAEKAEREGALRQLQQELADSLKKQSMSEASLEVTTRYRSDLEDDKRQLQKEIDRIKSKLQESEEQYIQSERHIHDLRSALNAKEHETSVECQKLQDLLVVSSERNNTIKQLEEHIQRLEVENARLEATTKQQTGRIEILQKDLQDSVSVHHRLEELITSLQTSKINLEEQLSHQVQKQNMLSETAQGIHSVWEEQLKSRSKLGIRVSELDTEKLELMSHLEDERKKVKKLLELKQSVEMRLDQETTRNNELQKECIGTKKLLKAAKKKLKDCENGECSSQTRFQEVEKRYVGTEVEKLRTKVDELSHQLDIKSTRCTQLESTNHDLQEQLSSLKLVHKSNEKLKKRNQQLEEEVANLQRYLQGNLIEHHQIEKYKRDIEERARQDVRKKLEEVNMFLQTQAASQEALEQIRTSNNATVRNQLEHRIRELESELARERSSKQDNLFRESNHTELEQYKALYSEEQKMRKSLGSKLDRANERLAEANAKILYERQRSRSLFASSFVSGSLSASPVLGTVQLGNLGSNVALNRSLSLGRGFISPTANALPSKNRAEAYLAKLLDQKSISSFSSLQPDT
ncbi:ankyrin repeat domain-containing protein 26-like isoform X3 [Hemicordylus capensis]|uniref:ankyrin repeat domain-containing protein 26-like isoform X3 n=1 Tax=Hemicordylus capensis TaxID=884348 RepID=UPI002302DDD2|nr:ankyrin repeat domain-containing protein 26-like isoform X3 [Hemicordylus capensis]XP_053114063.1 ankyrin repeat domain-containing protein 26-like isoform X3 [Hemicordylus capensis]